MTAKVYKTQPVILLLFHDRTQLIMIHSGQKVSIINALLWSLVVCMKLKLNWLCFQLMFAGPGHPIISCFTCAGRPSPIRWLTCQADTSTMDFIIERPASNSNSVTQVKLNLSSSRVLINTNTAHMQTLKHTNTQTHEHTSTRTHKNTAKKVCYLKKCHSPWPASWLA